MRQMSWFSCSKLSLGEVIFLSYDIMKKVPSKAIDEEYVYMESSCEKWVEKERWLKLMKANLGK